MKAQFKLTREDVTPMPDVSKMFHEKQMQLARRAQSKDVPDLSDEEKMALFYCAGLTEITLGENGECRHVTAKPAGIAKIDGQFRIFTQH